MKRIITTITLCFSLLLSGCAVNNTNQNRPMPDNVGNSQVVYQQQGITLLFIDEQHFSRLAEQHPEQLPAAIAALKKAAGVSEQFDHFIQQFLASRVFYGDRWSDYMASSLRFYVQGEGFDTPGFRIHYQVLTDAERDLYRGFNYSKDNHALTISLADGVYQHGLEFILPLPAAKDEKPRPDITFRLSADAVAKSLSTGSDQS
ncbi:hypothetical protein [Idiomarina xiamenensis]|uniref:Lipoprotein n=1 Tax=Idiomarina xiamenensis 10-D-4 TaxID=740709 RepID=K2KFR0_9GAMM|nr:hypothetical protein [Idiomarina xiamenensis]EKE86843.1 hypothetical protein A10D4_01337 [Idiomarina xiamenensis 10-D-4]